VILYRALLQLVSVLFSIYYGPYSSWKFLIFLVHLFVSFFWKHYLWLWFEIKYSGTALLLLVNPHIPHAPYAPVILSEKKILCCLNPLYSSTNQQLFEKNFLATMKVMDDFCYEWKPLGTRRLCSKFYLLCYAALLKNFAYYA